MRSQHAKGQLYWDVADIRLPRTTTVLTTTTHDDQSSLSAYANGEDPSYGGDEAPEMQS